MVWVQKQVIKCWIVAIAGFRVKWPKLLTIIFLSWIDGKQQQNDRKLCTKDLGEKCSYLGWFPFLVGFRVYGPVLLFEAFF